MLFPMSDDVYKCKFNLYIFVVETITGTDSKIQNLILLIFYYRCVVLHRIYISLAVYTNVTFVLKPDNMRLVELLSRKLNSCFQGN